MAEKYYCPRCARFIGFIHSERSGPMFEHSDCQDRDAHTCPAAQACARYVPLRSTKYRIGTTGGDLDDEGGSYRANAVRALEGD